METPMLKRRLNPFLLASTVLILSLLAGLSVLYQGQLDNVVSDRKELTKELRQKNTKIADLQEEKSNLSQKLESTDKDLQKYIRLYKSEKKERESLSKEVSELKETVSSLESDVSNLSDQVDVLNESINDICTDDETNFSDSAEYECEQRGYD